MENHYDEIEKVHHALASASKHMNHEQAEAAKNGLDMAIHFETSIDPAYIGYASLFQRKK